MVEGGKRSASLLYHQTKLWAQLVDEGEWWSGEMVVAVESLEAGDARVVVWDVCCGFVGAKGCESRMTLFKEGMKERRWHYYNN